MGKTEYIITIIIFNVFFILFIAAIIIYIRQYRIKKKAHITMMHAQTQEHQRELLSTQIEIQHQTMQHIGREIHDNIGQKLTLASLYTQQLAYENKTPQINDNIENISDIINQSLTELRALSKSLTNNNIDAKCISKLIETECLKIKKLKTCEVAFSSNANKIKLSYQTKSILLRISQEFLQNSIKHSKCKNITVSLEISSNLLKLCLQDDGRGFDTEKPNQNGIGLNNIKKRTEIIGALYKLQSSRSGTKLTIETPI
jgi:signal transduction histidine kinase